MRTALYETLALENDDFDWIVNIRLKEVQFDGYCTVCGAESTFRTSRGTANLNFTSDSFMKMFEDCFFDVRTFCTRSGHEYRFYFRISDKTLSKVGQFPSVADISSADLKKFRKTLAPAQMGELHRATGLASHGIGIGSFVYLRRIFENLIQAHRDEAAAAGASLEGFDKMRMAEKIGALAGALPPALVRNKAAYGILSKGLHELDEATCLAYFPVIRAAILEILEQDFQEIERARAAASLEAEIKRIADTLGSAMLGDGQ